MTGDRRWWRKCVRIIAWLKEESLFVSLCLSLSLSLSLSLTLSLSRLGKVQSQAEEDQDGDNGQHPPRNVDRFDRQDRHCRRPARLVTTDIPVMTILVTTIFEFNVSEPSMPATTVSVMTAQYAEHNRMSDDRRWPNQ